MRNPLWLLVRDLVQAGCVVLFPFYCELPAGVFVFWVTNSLWSLAQGAAVRRTATHRALRGVVLKMDVRQSPLQWMQAGCAVRCGTSAWQLTV